MAGMRAAVEVVAAAATSASLRGPSHPQPPVAARGGINAALGEGDLDAHAYDTVKGGDFLVDEDAVEIFTSEAPVDVVELSEWAPSSPATTTAPSPSGFGGAAPSHLLYRRHHGRGHPPRPHEQLLKERVNVYEEGSCSSCLVIDGQCRASLLT
jgi:succinate dehydrogenase/fumarate reductase flavoprotein subunit